MKAFARERAIVIGAGVAGTAAARVLAEEGAQVLLSDVRPRAALVDLGPLERLGVEVRTGGHDRSDLDGATLVLTSPGVPPQTDILRWARERGLPVWGELELGARLARAPYLAVTGTNGKTTTIGMLAACLRAAGLDAVACGNNGRPFPAAAREEHDALVVEASSFQLAEQTSFRPRISVLLNLAPDHLDHHGSFAAYASAKARIFANQTGEDVHVGNRDDPDAAALSAAAPCRVAWFGLGEPGDGDVGYVDGNLVARLGPRAQTGAGRRRSDGRRADGAAAAAAALAFGLGAPRDRGGPRRVHPGTASRRGRRASGRGAVRRRLEGDERPRGARRDRSAKRRAVLIAGGRAKGQDLSPLGTRSDRLVGVVAIGEAADDVVRAFEGRRSVAKAGSIEEAVRTAYELVHDGGTPSCWHRRARAGTSSPTIGSAETVSPPPPGPSRRRWAPVADRTDRCRADAHRLAGVPHAGRRGASRGDVPRCADRRARRTDGEGPGASGAGRR